MSNLSDLTALAQKLATQGPHKAEPTSRRIRALFNGHYAVDTTQAWFVWEHPYYPQYYIPISSLTKHANLTTTTAVPGTGDAVHFGALSVAGQRTERVLVFSTGALKDLMKVDFAEWFEEDERVYQHPKDPYKRIDILRSSRAVKIGIDGVTLAETTQPLILHETSLRPRYYLPPTSVNWEYLSKSETETYCPYKGKANYYDVRVGEKVYRDLVWWYRYPTSESAGIAGCVCFYNEKVDVWVDGVKEER